MIVKQSRLSETLFYAAHFLYLAYFEKLTRAGAPLYDQVYPKRLNRARKKDYRNIDAGYLEAVFSGRLQHSIEIKRLCRACNLNPVTNFSANHSNCVIYARHTIYMEPALIYMELALTDSLPVRTIEEMRRFLLFCLLLLLSLAPAAVCANGPAFDLTGPKVDVHVKRGTVTLPISEAPNLLPGDRLWIHPDLPTTQSEHFVLVVAFLRGTTNPPPSDWFTRVETWSHQAHDEGVFVTVPSEAQQALIFLAPETSGDFNTLRKAVRQEPGSFVRAAQDLQAASWERMRLEAYLADVKVTSKTNPEALKPKAEAAARSLGIKINESCFSKPYDEQASCLSMNSEGLVLDDSNAQSLVNQLATGSTLDLVNTLTSSSFAGGGMYSAYVGAVVDTAKILGSLHTAHFQYIPALALPTTDTLNLRLNMPPSFRNPKSVVVVALPPVGPTHPEALYAASPSDSYCAPKPGLVLPAGGAPLVFATPLAHNLFLRVHPDAVASANSVTLTGTAAHGPVIDVPVRADATEGGLVFDAPVPTLPAGNLIGELRGKWGFDDWEGPSFHLYSPEPGKWAIAPGDQSALVVGREDTLQIVGETAECVQRVQARSASAEPVTLAFTTPAPDTLQVKVPLKDAQPGPVSFDVYEYGQDKPDQLKMIAYDQAASLHGLTLSAGDSAAMLQGTRLDQVAEAKLHGIVLTPTTLNRVEDMDQLELKAGSSTAGLQPGKHYTAEVELKDGRRLKAPVTVELPRPQVMLLSKGVQNNGTPSLVQLGNPDDLPVDGRLVFFVKSTSPASFPRDEKIEVAAADSSFHTLLDLTDGSLLLEDAKTAVASVQPKARFGYSAFGPVRVRAVAADGQTSDWLPLGTLVRVPGFKELRCPRSVSKPCTLSGTNLFLASSVAATPQFDAATQIPPEFTGTELVVPHPAANGTLYVKLRDDPSTVQTLAVPITPITPAEARSELPAAEPQPLVPTPAPVAAPANAPESNSPAVKPDAAQATSGPVPEKTSPPPASTAVPPQSSTSSPGTDSPKRNSPANTTAAPTGNGSAPPAKQSASASAPAGK